MNFFNQGISLGRWFGITVVIHWLFLLWAANELFTRSGRLPLWFNVMYIVLLFGTVLVHEFGHALSCKAMGGEANHIVLWPLGGIAFVQPPMNPTAWLVTTACGPLVNAILWPTFWAINTYVLPRVELPPTTASLMLINACFLMELINKGLLLFNLIPAYPMDGGRLLQEILWFIVGYGRSLMIAGMVGTVAGGSFIVLGLGLAEIRIPGVDLSLGTKGHVDVMFAVIGLLCMMQSFAIYKRSQEIADWRKN
jgi:Zn-dependent protease